MILAISLSILLVPLYYEFRRIARKNKLRYKSTIIGESSNIISENILFDFNNGKEISPKTKDEIIENQNEEAEQLNFNDVYKEPEYVMATDPNVIFSLLHIIFHTVATNLLVSKIYFKSIILLFITY